MVRREAEDATDERLLHDVRTHGWHLIAINDDEDVPGYVFSVGMFHTLGHPEICIFGLEDIEAMAAIVNQVGQVVRDGASFHDGSRSDDILVDYSCVFREVPPRFYGPLFGYNLWFYEEEPFSMLQCVWPDAAGKYPWDADFDALRLPAGQPVLADEPDQPGFT